MANRFFTPFEQFPDSTGAALAGAQLFFYSSGTSTKLNTYSDSALSNANLNPIVLDGNGRPPLAIFMQNLKYKVIFAPATDTDPPTSPIWTADPFYTSDFSAVAQVQGVNGSPNGQLAGTAGSAGIPASVAWDYTNNILYVATVTGSSSTTVWTAINASTAAAVVPQPQGRLTLTTGTPVIAADVIAATTVFYTPYSGLLVPIYNGTSFVPTSIIAELNATLVASHVASNIYDFYIFLLNGVPTLGTGPSWSAGTAGSITAGSCARGTGASGAAFSRVSGILTNAVSMTMRYGNGTTTTAVAANQGTYIGSMFVDGTNGQVTCHASYGQSRKFGIWNAYNRQPIVLQAGDPTANWQYGNATIRQSNAAAGNTLASFTGLAEEWVFSTFTQFLRGTVNVSTSNMQNGIGFNSTIAYSGTLGQLLIQLTTATSQASGGNQVARYHAPPGLGVNNINACENTPVSSGVSNTFFGTQQNMLLESIWRG